MNIKGGDIHETGRLAIEILKKFPKAPKNSLAKKLYADHPLQFNSKEHARTVLKWHSNKDKRKSQKSKPNNLKIKKS